ncbi:MAG TPA: YezD family protein [Nitrosospira sp.]|nr:YezD family protein [Nitrosospira sp.]
MPASTEIIDLEEKHYGSGQSGRRIPVDVKQRILYAIASIEYGSVEVVIHDGKITYIECREKIRVGRTEADQRK